MEINSLAKKLAKLTTVFAVLFISSAMIASAKDSQVKPSCSNDVKKLEIFYNNKNAQIKPDEEVESPKSEQLELSELISLTLQNNPKIHKALFKSNASSTLIGQAKGRYAPELMAGSAFSNGNISLQNADPNIYPSSFSDFMYGRISVAQLVYDFGATSLQIKMAKDLYNESEFEIETVINDLIYDVRDKYYYLIFTRAQKKATEELQTELQEHIKLIQAHYKQHQSPRTCYCSESGNIADQSNVELNIANSEKLLIDSENNIEITEARLEHTVGLPHTHMYKISNQLDYAILDISIDMLIEIANNSRPELKYAQKRIDYAQKHEKSVVKEITPKLNLFGSYGGGGLKYNSGSYNNYGSYQVGAMFSTPWINPVIVRKKLQEARFVKNYEQASALEMADNTYLEIQEAYINYDTEIKNVEKTKKVLDQSKKVLANFKKMYVAGEDCYIHVGEFAFSVQKAKVDYYNSIYKLNSAKASMDKAVGKIITKEDAVNL